MKAFIFFRFRSSIRESLKLTETVVDNGPFILEPIQLYLIIFYVFILLFWSYFSVWINYSLDEMIYLYMYTWINKWTFDGKFYRISFLPKILLFIYWIKKCKLCNPTIKREKFSAFPFISEYIFRMLWTILCPI